MTFGRYPEVSLALVRERHVEARRLLVVDFDPMTERKAKRIADEVSSKNSFASLAERWLEHWQQGKSAHYIDSVQRRIAADILPCLARSQMGEPWAMAYRKIYAVI
jgi:hypothetical protein